MMNLRADIAEMFAELSDRPAEVEDALFRRWQRDVEYERERRLFARNGRAAADRAPSYPARSDEERSERRRASMRRWRERNPDAIKSAWAKRKADSERYGKKKAQNAQRELAKYHALSESEKKQRNRSYYSAIMANTERAARRRAKGTEWMRNKRAAAKKAASE